MTETATELTRKGVPHPLSAPTLRLKDISVGYALGSTAITSKRASEFALQNITFEIKRGERVAVVGPNGAGKSTLFKLIVGTIKPNNGTVQIYGSNPDEHICIAYVPQRSLIDWSFPVTVEDVVMMGRVGQIGLFRRPKRKDWDVVHASLARVNATSIAKAQIGDLSGGQQQRVFIARALAQEAELLLMDEPLSGLDVPSQTMIFDILDSLRPDGVTVIVATHDLNMAAERFDRVMLLNKQIISYGAATAVFAKENLVRAYGDHLHIVETNEDPVLIADEQTVAGWGHD
ncbi:MAG: metal ABC transporter ATP-binding protein [Chloroflexi bacterium]|nr:metal ABC transporter ATP-binding protein [Chloroflexota bacterium]